MIDDLEYANLYKRGYTYLKFTPSGSEAQWRFVDNVTSETTSTVTEKKYTIAYKSHLALLEVFLSVKNMREFNRDRSNRVPIFLSYRFECL